MKWMRKEGQLELAEDESAHVVELLKVCTNTKDLVRGSNLHAYIREHKFLTKNLYVGNTLVSMYAKCGAFSEAQQAVKELPVKSAITWNALITGYAQQGQGEEALKCFEDMLQERHSPTLVTFICALKACGSIGAVVKGKKIHGKIVSLGMLEKSMTLGNTLVDMYAKCGALTTAQRVLEELPVRDVVSWNALIGGCVLQGKGQEALKFFDDMLFEGHSPNSVTFICVLKACGSIGAAAKGEEIHNSIVSLCMLENDIVLGTTVVDMYAKCGAIAKAHQALKELPVRDVVSWSALIAAYVQQGQGEEALKCFDDMLHEGHSPNVVTFGCVLRACGSIRATAKGEEIHGKIISLGMLEKHIVLGNTLVDMYVKCGALNKAHHILKELPVRDVITWSALLSGYAQQGQGEEALKCLDDMLHEGHSPSAITFICALKACGSIGAISKGEEIHSKIDSLGMVEKDFLLGNSLVDMYAKCGALAKAQHILEELPVWDVVTWGALIAGYVQQGCSVEAISCFERMQSKGVKPDSIIMNVVLNACSNSGLLDEAETYFSEMSIKFGIDPNLEHHICMIDLFGRAGKLNKALLMIAKMPSDKSLESWVGLLGACRKWGDVKVGGLAFECARCLDTRNAAVYILMADIYAAAGMHEEANKVEVLRVANEA